MAVNGCLYSTCMVKDYPVGHDFYKRKGYKTITVHLPKKLHERLKKFKEKDGRSIEWVIRRLLSKGNLEDL